MADDRLNLQVSTPLTISRSGDIVTITVDTSQADDGHVIIYDEGSVRWGVPQGVAGEDGREIELRSTATHLEWRYVGDATWNQLIALEDMNQGAPGFSAYDIAVANGFVGTEEEWLASLQGGGVFRASENGTAAEPVISNQNDTDTGFFFPSLNTLAASVGGIERFRITSTGIKVEGTVDGVVPWSKLQGVPTSFPPTGHPHNISDITLLEDELDKKAEKLGDLSDVNTTGLQNGYVLTYSGGQWRPLAPTGGGSGFSGSYNDLTDVPATFTPSPHSHSKADIQDFDHGHDIDEIYGLEDALDAAGGPLNISVGGSGVVSIDCQNKPEVKARMTLAGNVTLAPTNVPNDMQVTITLHVTQNSTGGFSLTYPANTTHLNGGDGSINPTASSRSMVTLITTNGGSSWLAATADTRANQYDSFYINPQEDGDYYITFSHPMTLALGNVSTDGTGYVSFQKKPAGGIFANASGSTSFVAGDTLKVTVSGFDTYFTISIPRTA